MDHFLTEDQQMIVDLARQITDDLVIPNRARFDESEEYPLEIVETLADRKSVV